MTNIYKAKAAITRPTTPAPVSWKLFTFAAPVGEAVAEAALPDAALEPVALAEAPA